MLASKPIAPSPQPENEHPADHMDGPIHNRAVAIYETLCEELRSQNRFDIALVTRIVREFSYILNAVPQERVVDACTALMQAADKKYSSMETALTSDPPLHDATTGNALLATLHTELTKYMHKLSTVRCIIEI